MQVKLVPVQRESEKSPDCRVLTSTFEFGAAWKKTSQNGRDYLSVRLDDPSFATPIFANLVEGDNANDYILIWSRSQRCAAQAPARSNPDRAGSSFQINESSRQ
jgi:uncharacterized protein (DUF736 family)